jgi:hypothetical protein
MYKKKENVTIMEGSLREKEKRGRGGIIEKSMQERRKGAHKFSEREQENKERKEWRGREIGDVEVRK